MPLDPTRLPSPAPSRPSRSGPVAAAADATRDAPPGGCVSGGTATRGGSPTASPIGPVTTAAVSTARALDLDALVEATPASRERVVDLLRAVSIGVVVVWHWSLSLTHWRDDGSLTMPTTSGGTAPSWPEGAPGPTP